MIRPWIALAAAAVAGGCSLVNQPNIDFLDVDATVPDSFDAGDGSSEGGVDGGIDSGLDAAVASPEVCDSAQDEDLDSLYDCQDPDCLGDPLCCPRRGAIVDEDFLDGAAPGWDAGEWVPFGGEVAPVPSDDLRIDFGTGSGLFARERVDLSYGMHAELIVSPRTGDDDAACEALAGCRDHVGIALTPASEYTPGVELPTTLHVAITARGEILVIRGGVVRQRLMSEWAVAQQVGVSIDVLPTGQEGRRGFRVEVRKLAETDAEFPDWSPPELVLEETDNLGADGTQGAYLALMGRSETGAFTTLRASASFLGCDNPAVFVPTGDDALTATSLGLGAWAAGSIGAPAAVSLSGDRVRLLFDGSDIDLGLERYRLVQRAIGEATRDVAGDWTAVPGPVLGVDPPSAAASSVREPAMLADDETKAWMAIASAELPSAFGIGVAGRVGTWGPASTILTPGELDGPTSLRSPAVAQNPSDEGDTYHLWFIGTDEAGITALWHAVGDTSFEVGSIHDAAPVLDQDDVGVRAFRGLSEPIVAWDAVRSVFLIWFLAEDALGQRTLHHGIAPGTGASIELYDGNPVLDPQDPILGACDEGCTLRGGTVLEGDGRRTFLFSRSAGTESPVHEIVTVTQEVGGEQ